MDSFVEKKVVQFESYVNDVLKEDLRKLEAKLDAINTDLAEFQQLKTTISTIKATRSTEKGSADGFKTKLDIGNNFYVQAKVEDTETILLDVGLGHFVEFTLDEAVIVIDVRVRLLNRQAANLRKETARTKAHIKLILISIRELRAIK